MSLLSLPEEIASELAWSNLGDEEHNIEYVAHEDLGSSRWSRDYIVVFRFRDDLYGFDFAQPATEMQEGQDQFELNREGHVVVFPVRSSTRTVTRYARAPGVPS